MQSVWVLILLVTGNVNNGNRITFYEANRETCETTAKYLMAQTGNGVINASCIPAVIPNNMVIMK